MQTDAIIINGKFYAWIPNTSNNDCSVCALNKRCKSLPEGAICNAFDSNMGYTFVECDRVNTVKKIGNRFK